MILSKKNGASPWGAVAAIPALLLFWSLAGAAPAVADSLCTPGAMQHNRVNTRNGAENGTVQPMSRQTGNQPTSGPCHTSEQNAMQRSTSSGMANQGSNPGMDEKHAKAAARVNQKTGATEGPPVPLSNQKGNQPTSPVSH
jgi:hypothetical protein